MLAAPPAWIQPAANPAQASVVRVQAQDGTLGFSRQGSGVVVGPGLVATSAHVVLGGGALRIHQGDRSWEATLHCLDSAHDLAILKAKACSLPEVLWAKPGLPEGLSVTAWGHPLGRKLQKSEGRILAVWTYQGAPLYQTDVAVEPGSSGGGLFDAEGRLVGLTTFVFPQIPRTVFSVPAAWIQGLLDAPRIQLSELRETELLSGFLAAMAEEGANGEAWARFCRNWVQERPDDPDAWFALGHVLDGAWRRSLKDRTDGSRSGPNEGITALERALSLRASHARAWNNLGAARDAGNQFEAAERHFREALRLDPTYGLAWLNLGVTLSNVRRWEAAIQAYRKGLALVPDDTAAWAQLGYNCLRVGRYPEAVQALTVATRQAPCRTDYWKDLLAAATQAQAKPTMEIARTALKKLTPAPGVAKASKGASRLGTH